MNPYQVTFVGKIDKTKQMSYVVDLDRFNIKISHKGHSYLIRGFCSADYVGGGIFPWNRSITFYSGELGHVPKQQEIVDAICNALKMNLMEID